MPLTFFVELEAAPLEQLLARPGVLSSLQAAQARVAMAMLDCSERRARAVRRLQQGGIACTAWLLVDPEQGYWLSADNVAQAARRYRAVRDWARAERLQLTTVGLDIEMPHDDSAALIYHGRRALQRLFRRRRSQAQRRRASEQYAALLREIRDDGFVVETYQFPLIVDERKAGSTLLQRVLGVVDMVPDREVLMLYRSLLPGPLGAALVDAFGVEADGIAVGITGGGVPLIEEVFGHSVLDLDELLEDLRRARCYTEHLYVFSLEGCVERGYLEALCRADLDQPIRPALLAPLAPLVRRGLRAVLRSEALLERALG
jgi:hypothetical protein